MMAISQENWRQLRLPLAVLGSVLIIATLLYSYTDTRKTKAQQSLLDQNHAYAQAHERYLASGTESANIAKFLPQYQRLEKLGFIGEERRVDWIERLREINQRHKLFAITYDISIQQDYKLNTLDTRSFKLHRSIMALNFPLLHEGDLLTLLQTLRDGNGPTLMLRDCVIMRKAESTEKNLTPTLDANCEMDWLTLTEPVRATKP